MDAGLAVMKSLELKIPPAVVLLACACAMGWVARQTPACAWPFPGRIFVAAALATAGFGFGLAGLWAFWKARTSVNPHRPDHASAFVVHGVYRITRNPMYLGLLLILVAWAVYLANILALAGLPAFVLYMDRFQIRPEERALQAKFGDAFARYAKSVRRWI